MWNRITNKHVKVLGGVCAGFAHKFEVPSGLVRLLFLSLMVFTGVVPLGMIYAILWLTLPTENVSEEVFNKATRPLDKEAKKSNVNYDNLYSEVVAEPEVKKEIKEEQKENQINGSGNI